LERITTDFDRALAVETHTEVMTAAQEVENIKVSEWVTSLDFVAQYKAIISRRVGNTGSWFLEREEIRNWLGDGSNTRRIWCIGIRKFVLV